MHISTLLNERNIILNLEAASKEEVLEKLTMRLSKGPKVLHSDTLKVAVLERENLATTGVGDGFAIPHAKTDAVVDVLVSFAVTKDPIDFQSLDDQPVRLVFLLIGVESRVGTYLKLLSRARILMSSATFRKRLLHAETTAEVIQAFREEEERYFEIA